MLIRCPETKLSIQKQNQPNIEAYIRIMHASPNTPSVDIYLDGNPILKNAAYKGVSQYYPLMSGEHNLKVYSSGQSNNLIIDANITIPQNTISNIALVGIIPGIGFYPISEPIASQKFGRPCLRFVNLSPNSSALDMVLSDGTRVFDGVKYGGSTVYACLSAGTYNIQVRQAGTNNVMFTLPGVELTADNYYTIYTLGLVGKVPALEALIVPEPRA